ncbi:MAG: hypothetical protein IJX26_03075, partial [Clostridia bacterium]|nr:hypothetical protein [Clostridia bacterium]
ILESAIECDGFESLKYLNVDQVLSNKNLIIKACRGEGRAYLAEYIHKTLSPNRETSYMCHGELHEYSHYDERYEEVQKALLNDSEIQGYLYAPAKREESYVDKILKGAKLLVEENPEIVENITNSASTRFGEELKHE